MEKIKQEIQTPKVPALDFNKLNTIKEIKDDDSNNPLP